MSAPIAALAVRVVSWPVVVMWRGYVATVLWAWFIVPVFGLRILSIYEAVGIFFVIAIVSPIKSGSDDEDEHWFVNWINQMLMALVYPLFALAFGWFWKWLQWGVA